jgi:hypothetical protein
MKSPPIVLAGISAIFSAIALLSASYAADPAGAAPGPVAPHVEDIYIARSLRESRAAPTDFCAKSRTGFSAALYEDHYTFRSTATRASDGLITNTNVRRIGKLHACFGSSNDPALLHFYAQGTLGAVSFTGVGDCAIGKADYPEAGITGARCFLHLSDLPPQYIGGLLTTNSVLSRSVLGGTSDPPGYTQPSIATIRLWKRDNSNSP